MQHLSRKPTSESEGGALSWKPRIKKPQHAVGVQYQFLTLSSVSSEGDEGVRLSVDIGVEVTDPNLPVSLKGQTEVLTKQQRKPSEQKSNLQAQ